MKTIPTLILGVLALASVAFAADDTPAWKTDYDAALAEAKSSGKPVLVDFTGSDWCGWCIKLDEETFEKEAFKEFAAKNLVLLELDFPNKKEQSEEVKKRNQELAQKYKVGGFPTLLLLDSEGNEIARQVGYLAGGPDAMIAWVEKATKG